MPVAIRPERPDDAAGVRAVNAAAFGRDEEADLVAALHAEGSVLLSLVATAADGGILGHVLFSRLPITTPGHVLPGTALAPLAVLPNQQGRGIGAALVRAGILACREWGVAVIVVLGHPAYYPRFGFAPVAGRLHDPFAAGDAFMALELTPGILTGGTVRYAPAFGIPA